MSENSSSIDCGSTTLNLCSFLFMVYLLNVGYFETLNLFDSNNYKIEDDKNKMMFMCGTMILFSVFMLIMFSIYIKKRKDVYFGIILIIALLTIFNMGLLIFNFINLKNNNELTNFQQILMETSISIFFASLIFSLFILLKINDYIVDDRDIGSYLKLKDVMYTKENDALTTYLKKYINK